MTVTERETKQEHANTVEGENFILLKGYKITIKTSFTSFRYLYSYKWILDALEK